MPKRLLRPRGVPTSPSKDKDVRIREPEQQSEQPQQQLHASRQQRAQPQSFANILPSSPSSSDSSFSSCSSSSSATSADSAFSSPSAASSYSSSSSYPSSVPQPSASVSVTAAAASLSVNEQVGAVFHQLLVSWSPEARPLLLDLLRPLVKADTKRAVEHEAATRSVKQEPTVERTRIKQEQGGEQDAKMDEISLLSEDEDDGKAATNSQLQPSARDAALPSAQQASSTIEARDRQRAEEDDKHEQQHDDLRLQPEHKGDQVGDEARAASSPEVASSAVANNRKRPRPDALNSALRNSAPPDKAALQFNNIYVSYDLIADMRKGTGAHPARSRGSRSLTSTRPRLLSRQVEFLRPHRHSRRPERRVRGSLHTPTQTLVRHLGTAVRQQRRAGARGRQRSATTAQTRRAASAADSIR